MIGEFKVNDKDAFSVWGVFLTRKALNEFRKRSNNKPVVTNRSRLEHGERVVYNDIRKDARDIIIELNITASSREEFHKRYESFTDELDKGEIKMYIKEHNRNYYVYLKDHMDLEYFDRIGTFSVRLREPNPTRK